MKLAPSRFHVDELMKDRSTWRQIEVKGEKKFVPCRPMGYFGIRHRVKMAWAVFTGKADALFWEGQ